MEQVAHSLQKWAIERRSNPADFDQYGRSAFNRYYYSVFLVVRSLIVEFEPDSSRSHSSVPEMLTGSIHKELNNFRKSLMRRPDPETIRQFNVALAALNSLADLMRRANAARVAADYNPHIPVVPESAERFSLASTNITEAHDWPTKARLLTGQVRRAWRIARGGV